MADVPLIPPTDHKFAGPALAAGLVSAAAAASMLLTSFWLRQREGTPEARHCTLHVATMLSSAYFLHAAFIIAAAVFQLAVEGSADLRASVQRGGSSL